MKAQPQPPLKKLTPEKRRKFAGMLKRIWYTRPAPANARPSGYEHLSTIDAAMLLSRLANVHHPAVRLPEEGTFPALLCNNPREDFLRRLAASNN